ncbi:hypothetical protein TGMAS_274180 [Toxoplasma gondii MAS]|uniref:Uncharacterized protein n=1 Tax=Toxoplasma gondii MAS TaxID=943118 RepID=A0A086QX28_TOXGO|nr:hypothetical protein TGMAS_274180 [Toxoplasma gondii MAS]
MQEAPTAEEPRVEEGSGSGGVDRRTVAVSQPVSTAGFHSAQFRQTEPQTASPHALCPSSCLSSLRAPSHSPAPHGAPRGSPDPPRLLSPVGTAWAPGGAPGDRSSFFPLPGKHAGPTSSTPGFASPFPSPAGASSSPPSPSPSTASSASNGLTILPLWRKAPQMRETASGNRSFLSDGCGQDPHGPSGLQKPDAVTHPGATYPSPSVRPTCPLDSSISSSSPHRLSSLSSPLPSSSSPLPSSTESPPPSSVPTVPACFSPSGVASVPTATSSFVSFAAHAQTSPLRSREPEPLRGAASAIAATADRPPSAPSGTGGESPETRTNMATPAVAAGFSASLASPAGGPAGACGSSVQAEERSGPDRAPRVPETCPNPAKTPAGSTPRDGAAAPTENETVNSGLPKPVGGAASGPPVSTHDGTPSPLRDEGEEARNKDASQAPAPASSSSRPQTGEPCGTSVAASGACRSPAGRQREGLPGDCADSPSVFRAPLKASPALSRGSPGARRPQPGADVGKRPSFSSPSSSGSSHALSRSPSASSFVVGGEDGATVLLDQQERVSALLRRRHETSAACLRLLRDEVESETRRLRQLETRVRWRMQRLVERPQRPGAAAGQNAAPVSLRLQEGGGEKGNTPDGASSSSRVLHAEKESGCRAVVDDASALAVHGSSGGERPAGGPAANERDKAGGGAVFKTKRESKRDEEEAERGTAGCNELRKAAESAEKTGEEAGEDLEEEELLALSFHAFLETRTRQTSVLRAAGEGRWHMVPVKREKRGGRKTGFGETQKKRVRGLCTALADAETATVSADCWPETEGRVGSPQRQGETKIPVCERGGQRVDCLKETGETPGRAIGRDTKATDAVPEGQGDRSESSRSGEREDDVNSNGRATGAAPYVPDCSLENLDEVQLQLLWLNGGRQDTGNAARKGASKQTHAPVSAPSLHRQGNPDACDSSKLCPLPSEKSPSSPSASSPDAPASYLDRLGVAVATAVWQDFPWNFTFPSFSSSASFSPSSCCSTSSLSCTSSCSASSASSSTSSYSSSSSSPSSSASLASPLQGLRRDPRRVPPSSGGRLFRWERYVESGCGDSEDEESVKVLQALLKDQESHSSRAAAAQETRARQYRHALREYHAQCYKMRLQQLVETKPVEAAALSPSWMLGASASPSPVAAGVRPSPFPASPLDSRLSLPAFNSAQMSACGAQRPSPAPQGRAGEEETLHARLPMQTLQTAVGASLPGAPFFPQGSPSLVLGPVGVHSAGDLRAPFSSPFLSPFAASSSVCMHPGADPEGSLSPDRQKRRREVSGGDPSLVQGAGVEVEQGVWQETGEGLTGQTGEKQKASKSAARQTAQPRRKQKIQKVDLKRRQVKEESGQ